MERNQVDLNSLTVSKEYDELVPQFNALLDLRETMREAFRRSMKARRISWRIQDAPKYNLHDGAARAFLDAARDYKVRADEVYDRMSTLMMYMDADDDIAADAEMSYRETMAELGIGVGGNYV